VLAAVAQALGVKEAQHKPLIDHLKRHLRDKDILLVLDNFEQVPGASGSVYELLVESAGLKVLATSRTLLHVYGEHDFPVPPLALPAVDRNIDIEALARTESVALFVQRAQAARPDFALTEGNAGAVAQICAHLEGLPLAIELAAARVRLLPPQAILPRVANRMHFLNGGALNLPARQRTLRGAVEWSYDLLEPDEQWLFRGLAVFVGGAGLDSIEQVLGSRMAGTRPACPVSVLDILSSLIDKSLLRQEEGVGGEPRFVMLETVREYALERLGESVDGDVVRQAHAEGYLELAERIRTELPGPQQTILLDQLEEEHGNLNAALEWLNESAERGGMSEEVVGISPGAPDFGTMALRLARAMHPFWEMRGYMTEGRTKLDATLRAAGPDADSEARAHALYSAGRLALIQGDDQEAERLTAESLELHRKVKHKLGMSCALVSLGHVAIRHGESARAREFYEEAFILRTEIGDPLWIARSLASLGYLAHFGGDYERAVELHEQGLALCREAGDKSAIGGALIYLGHEVAGLGQYERMRELLDEGLRLFAEVGSSHGIADCLAVYGKGAHARGEWEWAAVLFGLAKTMLDAIGLPLEPPSNTDLSEYEQDVEGLRERLGAELFGRLWRAAPSMSAEEAVAYGGQGMAVKAQDGKLLEKGHVAGLTPREVEVLKLVACGLTNVEAADRLTVSRHTINMHLRSIYGKLAVSSRTGATRVAIAQGIV
jgi:non-specific serine/threonine protein kinase